jgi:hypothetical protein
MLAYDGGVVGGKADTDCAFALAANAANTPTLSTVDILSKLTRGLRFANIDQS